MSDRGQMGPSPVRPLMLVGVPILIGLLVAAQVGETRSTLIAAVFGLMAATVAGLIGSSLDYVFGEVAADD